MAHIQVLDKHTAELIAAGEVVERPSSVVKELLENTIDAGAKNVSLDIRSGGIHSITITDNGSGIVREDVPTAFLRHATSKVRTENDLEAIGTLGFRGEALASIAAVARVEMTTRTKDELAGTRYVIEGGEEILLEDAGCPQGTTIVVRDLFYNVPARMKFLKKDVSEGNAVAGVVDRIALSHPEVSIRFVREGKEELLTPGDGDLHSCIYAVFGREFAGGLMPVDYAMGGVHVHGFLCKPAAVRANRTMQHFFINGRYVKTRTAMAAMEQAYKGSIMVGKFPSCVLHLDMPAETVDANVHPAKIEVRFINEKPVFDAVYHAVRTALESGDTRRQVSLPPRVVTPPKPEAEQLQFVRPQTAHAAAARTAERSFPETADKPAAEKTPRAPVSWAAPPASPVSSGHVMRSSPADMGYHVTASRPSAVRIDIERTVDEEPVMPPAAAAPPKPAETLPEMAGEAAEGHPPIRCLGEAFKTYIIAEMDGALYFIDKHAAHERILYNRFKQDPHSDAQQLLAPVTVALSREEYAALIGEMDTLTAAGFEIEDFGAGTVLVRALPMLLDGSDVEALLQEIAGGFVSGRKDIGSDKLDWIYHSSACRAAVKAGDTTRPEEWQELAQRVLWDQDIRTCPHGRPVCIEFSRHELEKQFGRLGG